MTIMKLTGIRMAANMPKARIGLISDNALAKKATAVVLEVTRIALKDRLNAKARRLCSLLAIKGWFSACRQASQKTKISSAAMPKTMKIVS